MVFPVMLRITCVRIFVFAILALCSTAQANTVSYTLDNVIQDNNQQMTGTFDWTYAPGDFENGSGVFTDLYLPGWGSDTSQLTITFDIQNSIEFSFAGNVHSGGLTDTLFLQTPLAAGQGALLDLTRSAYEVEAGAQRGGFLSGSIQPVSASPVPLPSAVWLFTGGLFGILVPSPRRRSAKY